VPFKEDPEIKTLSSLNRNSQYYLLDIPKLISGEKKKTDDSTN